MADLRSVANETGVSGELRLGACPTALAGMLPDVLARMVETFPGINVFIKPGYSVDLYRAVEAGRIMEWLRRVDDSKKIPIIVITGGAGDKDKERAMAGGAVAVLYKPLDHDELLKLVRSTLAAQPAA